MDVRLNTRLELRRRVGTSALDGDEFDADTIVWTAGVKPNPMLDQTDLPLDDEGPAALHAEPAGATGSPGVLRPGDCAAVPGPHQRTRAR